ncbi:MAG: hypothetical protein ACE5HL_02820 [Terriglobia bacterium]
MANKEAGHRFWRGLPYGKNEEGNDYRDAEEHARYAQEQTQEDTHSKKQDPA